MKNSEISEKEILVHNDNYAVIIFDDLNYDMLQKSTVEYNKDDPEKGISKGDTRVVWKSIPCYSPNAQLAIKKFFEYSLKKELTQSKDFIEAVSRLETLYSKIEKQFDITKTPEYLRFKGEQEDAANRLRKSRD